MYGLDMINTSVLGALGCDMNTFLRYFPAAETMYSLLVALAIGLILLGWVWNLFKNYGLGLGVDAEDPVKLTAKAILFIVLAYYADEIVNIALTIGGTPYAWILSSELPSLDFASFNSVLLTIIGVCANGGVALIVLILTLILAWNYIIVARTNVLRAERGIAALTADDQLMRAAQVRADEMAATGTYSHTRPDGRKYYTVTDCRQVGENIHQIPLLYLAQQKTTLAETLVYSWSKSAGHMENMTDESYAAIGVGLARGTDANGLECWYCVQLFLRSGYSISAVDKPATK